MMGRRILILAVSIGLFVSLGSSTFAYEILDKTDGSSQNMSVWVKSSGHLSSESQRVAQACRTAGQDCADQSECCSDLICERISKDSDPDGEIQVCVRP